MAGATYKAEGDILVQGINIIIRVDLEDETGGNPQALGFVESYQISANINLQRAE